MGDVGKGIELALGGPAAPALRKKLSKKPGTPGKNLDEELAFFAKEILESSRATRNTYFQQLTEALTTGNVQALIPAEQRAVEGALLQGSDEQRVLKNQLAGGNLVQTPLGQEALAKSRLIAEQRAGAAPSDLINQLLLEAPAATIGQAQSIGLESQNAISEIAASIQRARSAASLSAIGSVAQGVGGLTGTATSAFLNAQSRTATPPPRFEGQ
jgi:hypothetical protein